MPYHVPLNLDLSSSNLGMLHLIYTQHHSCSFKRLSCNHKSCVYQKEPHIPMKHNFIRPARYVAHNNLPALETYNISYISPLYITDACIAGEEISSINGEQHPERYHTDIVSITHPSRLVRGLSPIERI